MSETQQSSPENDSKEKNIKNPRKRQVHNEVERRRKDKINGWIMKISELLPNSELQKSSKISILEQTVGYIQELVSERNKLLSENCSDVQEKEVRNLKKKVLFLEAQNTLYVKLLQQAKISLTSLPKKTPKYSNKFTEENSEVLLKKLRVDSGSSTDKSLSSSSPIANDSGSSDSTSSVQSTSSAIVNISTSCANSSTSVTKPSFVQIQSKIKIPRIVTTCQNTSSNVTVLQASCVLSETRNASLVTVPTCTLETRTTFSAGGVTSALSPFPVMSSTLGSSFGNVYSRSIPTVIILPTGGGFVHPSLLSSNISVISPAVENVLPIIVPQQSHNVPTTTSVVNVLGPNGVNQIVSGVSQNLPTILPLPTSHSESAIVSSSSSSVDEAHKTPPSTSAETTPNTTVPLAEGTPTVHNDVSVASEAPTSHNHASVAKEAEKNSNDCGIENGKDRTVLIDNTPVSNYAILTSSPTTNFATSVLNKETNLSKPNILQSYSDQQCVKNKTNLPIFTSKSNSSETVGTSIAKKCTRNVPLSLQALSANKIISLANKLQGQANQSSILSNKVSAEGNSVLCVDSVSLQESAQLPLGNRNTVSNNTTSTAESIPSISNLVTLTTASASSEVNQNLGRNASPILSSQDSGQELSAAKLAKTDESFKESVVPQESTTKSLEIASTKEHSIECTSVQSDPKVAAEQSYCSAQTEKSSTNKILTSTSENTSVVTTATSCPAPQLSSSSTSNVTQVFSWSSNPLELESNNTILAKKDSQLQQFDSNTIKQKATEGKPMNNNQSLNLHQVHVNAAKLDKVENTVANTHYTSTSPCAMTSASLQKITPNTPNNQNPNLNVPPKVFTPKEHLSNEYITTICGVNPPINSTNSSKCNDSTTSGSAINSSDSHLYSEVTYVNNTVAHNQPSDAVSHPPVAWVRPTSHTFSPPSSVREKEPSTYPFVPSDYQSNITLHPVETRPTFSVEKQDKNVKNRPKSVKKSKSLPGLNSSSFNIIPDIANTEHFSTTTGDIFPSTQPLISEQRNEEHSSLIQSSENLNSTSDILAKAAESIFGHDAFHSMEIASEEPSSQGSIMPYDINLSYSNAEVFTHVFTSSNTTKNTTCGNFSVSKFGDNRFQDANSNKTKALDKLNPCSSINNESVTYGINSETYARTRKAATSDDSEPHAKKARETLPTTSSSLSVCPAVSSTICSQRDVTKFQTHLSKPQKQAINNGNATNMQFNNIPRSAKNAAECLQTQQATFYAVSKKQNFIDNQPKDSSLNIISPHSVSSGVSTDLAQVHQTTISQAPCVHITHPVNNLFVNSVNIGDKNKTITAQNKLDNRRNCHLYSSGNDTTKQGDLFLSSHKDLNTLKIPTSTNSDNVATSSHMTENSLSHFLNHSTTMAFPSVQNPNNQVTPILNHFDLFSAQSSMTVPIPHAKSQMSNVSQILEMPTQLPHALNSSHSTTQDIANRVQAPFNPNLQNYRTATDIHTKTCVQPSVHTTSLSHSLCSLLKETPSNTISRDLAVNSSSFSTTSTSLSANVSVPSGVSKYSALSLISNQPCLATKPATASKSSNISASTNVSSTLQLAVSVCSKNSKSLSYSAERLIQNQYPLNDKDKEKIATTSTLMPSKTLSSDLYKPSNYIPTVSSEINMQSLPRMPLPPATSYPTFPPSFSICDVRPAVDIHSSSQYQDISQNTPKDIFSQTTNFSVSSQVQNSSCTSQNVATLPKSHPNLSLNFENSGAVYNSCNFLQPPVPSMDSGKPSDGGACFPPIFVNSNYSQQTSKKNYCHFVNQIPPQVTDTTVEKNFSIIPPLTPFSDKSVGHEHRQPHESSITQNAPSYVGNLFYEPTSCTHESIGGGKPSNQRISQEMYVPHRTKQNASAQPPCISSPLKTQSQNKGKTRKSKHSAVDLNRTNVFNPNNCMNFNVFTVPDLSCGKSNLHHVPNNYKNTSQPVIPSIGDIPPQQGKIPETILNSVISPHHTPFNAGLHQQNDLLNLNFQTPNYSGTPLTMHPPLTLSSCAPAPKTTRSFSSVPNPVPNFNLSNILPDMGCSTSDISFSPIKFPPECQPNSSSASAVLSAPHQTCASSLYTPHPSVVPNALPPLLNHAPHALNRSRAPLPASASIPQPHHFSSPQTQPFQNIIHSLNFSRPDRQN